MNSYTVLFENSDFIVVDKASGVLSVPSRVGEKETRPVLGKILEAALKIKIFPVHRLDAEVSGILLYAKNAQAHREANQVFENHWVQKTYEALSIAAGDFQKAAANLANSTPAGKFSSSDGQFPEIGATVEWRSKLLRGKKRAYESSGGKDSLTRAKIKAKLEWRGHLALLWELEPVTGRSHQLRFEMARHKVPICGDTLYGSTISILKNRADHMSSGRETSDSDVLESGGIALRAVKIDFTIAHGKNLLKTLPLLIEARDLVSFLK